MEDLLEDLNESQKKAVTTTEGYVRLIAGAGSGKTRALTYRFAYLVNELGILPENILCVTFTSKAAAEMRQRIHNLTGDNDTGYINTFHGFCVSVLQEDSNAVLYPKSFLVLDNSDINQMLQIIYDERGLTLREMTFARARDMIEMLKLIEKPEYYLDMINMSLDVLKKKYDEAKTVKDIIFYGYLYQEKKCFGLDYNDLLKFTLHIMETNEEIKLKWQERLEYIMIDEFQDIDKIQYRLMEVLSGYHRNLFIVGDPDQTIYTWRGANVRFLLDFDQHFLGTKTIMMNENYRSSPEIIGCCNSLISRNKKRIKKDLVSMNPPCERTVCYSADNAEEEALWISSKVKELSDEGIPLNHMAVLYRAHYVTRTIEDAFNKKKIPYTIYSGVQFYDRSEIKDALSYLRMIAYKDDLSFMRICNVPKRNIGEQRMIFLKDYAEKNSCTLYKALKDNLEESIFKGTKAQDFVDLIEEESSSYADRPISELLSEVLNKSLYEKALRTEGSQARLDNLAELKQSIFEYETTCGEESTLEHYLSHVALFSNADVAEEEHKVKLMTVHAAKGLEFDNVFLCAMNEGIFPGRKIKSEDGMEEERRLAFVAMTRAKKRLFISEAEGINLDGAPRYPSRFILNIDQSLLDYPKKRDESLIKQAELYVQNSERWMDNETGNEEIKEGDRVRHGVMGEGTVTECNLQGKYLMIQFDGISTPRKISFKANLKKI